MLNKIEASSIGSLLAIIVLILAVVFGVLGKIDVLHAVLLSLLALARLL